MAEYLDSNSITNADAQPIVAMRTGEGAPGRPHVADDTIANTTAVAQWSTYRLCRFPTNAKVKHVYMSTSGIDSNLTATAKLDFNVAFSDSTTDGTPANWQGTIPSSNFDGTSLPFVNGTGYNTGYVSAGTGNKLFGSAVAISNSGAAQNGVELTWKNTFTVAMRQKPMWNALGFTDGQGSQYNPGGNFDILAVVSAAVATAAVGTISIEVDYVA